MQSPISILNASSYHTTLVINSLTLPRLWSGRSHGDYMTRGRLQPKPLLQSFRVHKFPRYLRSNRTPWLRTRAGSNPQRRTSDMISQLELDKSESPPTRRKSVSAIFWLLLLNIGIYVADHWLQFVPIKLLYLYHDLPRWYQFITATFCHVNWSHLSSNLFFLYIFGKLVEEEEGGFALWLSYLVTGAGANIVSWLILPRTIVSIGASGAVFGLFAVSVLVKISWDWRKILEVLILGQFVIEKVASSSSAKRNWSTYGFIHSVKRNRLGSRKAEDLVYVHSNLRLASRRGPEYTIGSSKEWDVDPESADLDISLAALNIEEPRSGVGQSSSSQQSIIGRASCSIFQDEYEDEPEDDDY